MPDCNTNLLYNNDDVYSALLNIIMELKRALRILLEATANYRKIPKISPSMYKPPKLVTQKSPPLNCPSKYKPPVGFVSPLVPKFSQSSS